MDWSPAAKIRKEDKEGHGDVRYTGDGEKKFGRWRLEQ